MPNSYFRFKQFTVQQEKCAMKVCTDSCLFGAWTANYLYKSDNKINNILDIGSGTGLLSLMLAQQLPTATIDAIEIDEAAALQTEENFAQSPWKERLHIYRESAQNFASKKYNFIICNPPFYRNDLQSSNQSKNTAHHNTGLTLIELMIAIKRLLKDDGNFAILLPYHRTKEIEKLAMEAGFILHRKTVIKQTEQHDYFRSMMIFSTGKKDLIQDEIAIKNKDQYTPAFIDLLKDYYLYL